MSPEKIKELEKNGIVWNDTLRQSIETAFSEEIEAPFSELLREIIFKANTATPWHINNCYFISEEKKFEFSGYLALQFIRTTRLRNGLLDVSDCFKQIFADMGVPEEIIEKHTLSPIQAKYSHLKMLFDVDSLREIIGLFNRLTWILGINRTKANLFTSDNPIATHAHVKDSFLSMNGLSSKGVEVLYPLSPKLLLIMVDGSYHTQWAKFDRWYREITDKRNIEFYNSLLALQVERFVFSADGQMDILDKMKQKDPNVFSGGHTQINWGGKTYTPRNN